MFMTSFYLPLKKTKAFWLKMTARFLAHLHGIGGPFTVDTDTVYSTIVVY